MVFIPARILGLRVDSQIGDSKRRALRAFAYENFFGWQSQIYEKGLREKVQNLPGRVVPL